MRFEQNQEQDNTIDRSNGSSEHIHDSTLNGKHSTSHTNGITNGFHKDSEQNNAIATITHDDTPFHGHRREEVTRILLQSLSDLGFRGAAEQLSRESGYQLETSSVAAFRNAVLAGAWEEAEELLLGSDQAEHDGGVPVTNGIGDQGLRNGWHHDAHEAVSRRRGFALVDGTDTTALRSLIRQQKYLELLEQRDISSALHVLRNELTALKRDTSRLHTLSALMMCNSPEDLRARAQWDGARGQSRQQLLSQLSQSIAPSVMIPEHRLATLLTTIQDEQISQCRYHNTLERPSLYTDHECSASTFPMHTMQELKHSDEVWCVAFSSRGKWLATAGKDGSVYVYDGTTFQQRCRLRNAERSGMSSEQIGICHLSFSPDERYLLLCSFSNMFIVHDLSTPQNNIVASADHFDGPVSSAAWLPDSDRFIVGTQCSMRPLGMYSVKASDSSAGSMGKSTEIASWRKPPRDTKGQSSFRITNVAISKDGTRLAAATTTFGRIMIFDLETRVELASFAMDSSITSMVYSPEGDLLLVNLRNGRVMAIDSMTGEELMLYKGVKMDQFEIRSCFGGAGDSFVVSGSEDSRILIWRRQTGEPVIELFAHNHHAINAVAWHPTTPAIFASAGDDGVVRIWASDDVQKQRGFDPRSRPDFIHTHA